MRLLTYSLPNMENHHKILLTLFLKIAIFDQLCLLLDVEYLKEKSVISVHLLEGSLLEHRDPKHSIATKAVEVETV